jgi:hypothetical protein
MPAVFVTQQELRTNLGIGTLYADATVEEFANRQKIYSINIFGLTLHL